MQSTIGDEYVPDCAKFIVSFYLTALMHKHPSQNRSLLGTFFQPDSVG